jgi:hypothetical protein
MPRPTKPIPTEVLKDILARRKDDPEVLALLWEIWRYRAIARRSYQLAKSVSGFDSTRKMLIAGMLELVENDPAVVGMRAWQEELLWDYTHRTPERKKRD